MSTALCPAIRHLFTLYQSYSRDPQRLQRPCAVSKQPSQTYCMQSGHKAMLRDAAFSLQMPHCVSPIEKASYVEYLMLVCAFILFSNPYESPVQHTHPAWLIPVVVAVAAPPDRLYGKSIPLQHEPDICLSRGMFPGKYFWRDTAITSTFLSYRLCAPILPY